MNNTTLRLNPQAAHRQALEATKAQARLVDDIASKYGTANPVFQCHADKLADRVVDTLLARSVCAASQPGVPAGCTVTFAR